MINCRVCKNVLNKVFCDLNKTPLANSYRVSQDAIYEEKHYPLKVFFCSNCFLVQLPEIVRPEHIFTDYPYFSSYSSDWLDHASDLCELSIKKLSITNDDLITEIASNDGYLLKKFKKKIIIMFWVLSQQKILPIMQINKILKLKIFFLMKKHLNTFLKNINILK